MKSIHTDLVVQRHGVVLDKSDHGFENAGALNPACIRVGDEVHMFYRAVRHGNYSTVGHCILKGPREVAMRADKPLMMPEHPYESQGIEDPRIVKIDDTYYMTYTVYDRMNALGAYATSQDLKTFIKHPVITPQFTYREFKKLIDCWSWRLSHRLCSLPAKAAPRKPNSLQKRKPSNCATSYKAATRSSVKWPCPSTISRRTSI
ncbi:MAG: hypothetical protein KA941_07780 [Flavobacteriales bacterium]|nr:hypothetical protein [Flavobacteriales bacterium]